MNQQYVNNTNNISSSQTEKSGKKEHKKNIASCYRLEQGIKNQQLQEITKKYGKVIDQEIRKDGEGKIGNIAIVTFSTEGSAEKAITGKNKTNKYIAQKI